MSELALKILPYAGFVIVALAAIAFASFAVWRPNQRLGEVRTPRGNSESEGPNFSAPLRKQRNARLLLSGAIALFLLGVGGGTYWITGQPHLALRAAQGTQTRDIRGLVPFLIERVRKTPDDEQAWIFLGRAYLAVNDGVDAAKAYGRAVTIARLAHNPDPTLLSTYGEILVAAEGGVVSPEAEDAFTESLQLNPRDPAARYFLGEARAMRGDKQGAIAFWQSLLADVPASAALHQELIDRIALLTSQLSGSAGAPDPTKMVAMQAAELKANPHNAAGWQRLIRAYTVLGEPDKAKAALATARSTFANDTDELKRLDTEAVELNLL